MYTCGKWVVQYNMWILSLKLFAKSVSVVFTNAYVDDSASHIWLSKTQLFLSYTFSPKKFYDDHSYRLTRRILTHRDTRNIPVGSSLTICIGPLTSVLHKNLANITKWWAQK